MARSATSNSRTSSKNFASLAYGPVFGRTGAGGLGFGAKVVRAGAGAAPAPLPAAVDLDPPEAGAVLLAASFWVDFLAGAAGAPFFAGGAAFLATAAVLRGDGAAFLAGGAFLAVAGTAFFAVVETTFFA